MVDVSVTVVSSETGSAVGGQMNFAPPEQTKAVVQFRFILIKLKLVTMLLPQQTLRSSYYFVRGRGGKMVRQKLYFFTRISQINEPPSPTAGFQHSQGKK